ncbi:unnamed protein product [Pleuronectes platessa]|uniref:WxxW domain-containing protein n=1 Tax=Pleuronectes platessa TaxID=8262 RepID=A0A9N7TWB9_PLEPL|nr:unnamed protein product [Pleuronectes platessa]
MKNTPGLKPKPCNQGKPDKDNKSRKYPSPCNKANSNNRHGCNPLAKGRGCNPIAKRPGCQQQPDPINTYCWTDWFDRDDPTATGDWEILSDLHSENVGKICKPPLKIEVQTTSGLNVSETGDVIAVADTTTGFICKNSDQKQGKCQDYRVRFMCPNAFCSHKVCWTNWFNRDRPSGIGDWELLDNLRKENPGEICEIPLFIDAVTVDGKDPASSTGQSIFILSPTKGFVCRNRDQTGCKCRDYQVRFGCPCRSNGD